MVKNTSGEPQFENIIHHHPTPAEYLTGDPDYREARLRARHFNTGLRDTRLIAPGAELLSPASIAINQAAQNSFQSPSQK